MTITKGTYAGLLIWFGQANSIRYFVQEGFRHIQSTMQKSYFTMGQQHLEEHSTAQLKCKLCQPFHIYSRIHSHTITKQYSYTNTDNSTIFEIRKIDFRFNNVRNTIKNTTLSSVAKDLFKMAVCFKPKLIRGGIRGLNRLKRINQTDDVMAEMEEILSRGNTA